MFTAVINNLPSQLQARDMLLFANDGEAVGPVRYVADHSIIQLDFKRQVLGHYAMVCLSVWKSVSAYIMAAKTRELIMS